MNVVYLFTFSDDRSAAIIGFGWIAEELIQTLPLLRVEARELLQLHGQRVGHGRILLIYVGTHQVKDAACRTLRMSAMVDSGHR
jgi:hypothetical protein